MTDARTALRRGNWTIAAVTALLYLSPTWSSWTCSWPPGASSRGRTPTYWSSSCAASRCTP